MPPLLPVAAVEASAPKEPAGPLSPLVRRMARENNIDLSKVAGTGAGGRITKEDVEAQMKKSSHRPFSRTSVAAGACTSTGRHQLLSVRRSRRRRIASSR